MWLYLLLILSVLAKQDSSCDSDSDCPYMNSCSEDKCHHKNLFPLEVIEYFGIISLYILAGLSNAGGIGGGAMMLPVIILMLGFLPQYSIPLSQVIIFGGSLIASIMNLRKRHPTKNRPLIFYELALLTISPLLMGTTIGVILNEAFPEWLIELMLTVILCYMTYNSGRRAKNLYRKETQAKQEFAEKLIRGPTVAQVSEDIPIVTHKMNPLKDMRKDRLRSESGYTDNMNEDSLELRSVYNVESKTFPYKTMIFIVSTWLFVILITFLKGGSGSKSVLGLQKCSGGWAAILACFGVILTGFTVLASYLNVKTTAFKERINYDWDEFDLKWSYRKCGIIGGTAFVTGILAGMLGFGGGMIMNPLMLSFGLRPEQTTATSSFMVLFTSSVAVIQYSTANLVQLDYGIMLFIVAFLGSATGVFVLKRLVDKYKRPSIIVITLCIILGIAAVIIPVYGIVELAQSAAKGEAEYGFSSICK